MTYIVVSKDVSGNNIYRTDPETRATNWVAKPWHGDRAMALQYPTEAAALTEARCWDKATTRVEPWTPLTDALPKTA